MKQKLFLLLFLIDFDHVATILVSQVMWCLMFCDRLSIFMIDHIVSFVCPCVYAHRLILVLETNL